MGQAWLYPRPASSRVPYGVEAREDAAALGFGGQVCERVAVETFHHERSREVQRPSCVEEPGIELLGAEGAVCARYVEEGPLARRVDEDDRRRRGNAHVTKHALPLDAALVQKLEEKIAERVDADLADDRRLDAERDERARGVQGAPSTVKGDLVEYSQRAAGRQLADRARYDVSDEDSEADDVHLGSRVRAHALKSLKVAFYPNALGGGSYDEGGTWTRGSAVDPPFPLDDEENCEPPSRLDLPAY